MTKLARCFVIVVLGSCLLSSTLSCSGLGYGTKKLIGEMTLTRLEELRVENEQLRVQLEQTTVLVRNTQKLLAALNFPPQAAKAFRQLGWQVKEQVVPVQPAQRKQETKQEDTGIAK